MNNDDSIPQYMQGSQQQVYGFQCSGLQSGPSMSDAQWQMHYQHALMIQGSAFAWPPSLPLANQTKEG